MTARIDAAGEDRNAFGKFVEDVTSLPREKYLKVISCVRAFADSIESLTTNFDTAYSMLVYMLEALSRASDEKFTPTWQDYEEGQRKKIETLCEKIDESVAISIKAVLTNTQHLKLSKRFVNFVINNVQDTFFTNEAEGRQWAIRKSELPRLLKNVYITRSGYVHELQEPLEDIRFHCTEPTVDTIRSRNDVHFSYSGLVRLARHVLISFVTNTPKPAQETISWRNQIPGLVTVEFAPDYWIWKTEGFSQEFAKHRFSGFAAYFLDLLTKPAAMMLPLRPVIDIIDKELPFAKMDNKPAMISIFWLYNMHVVKSHAVENWEAILDNALNAEKRCHIEYLAVITLVQGKLSFDAETSEAAFREYAVQKYHPKGVCLPPRLEVGVLSYISNMYLEEGKQDDYKRIIEESIADLAGFPNIQASLALTRDLSVAIDIGPLLGQPAHRKSSDKNADHDMTKG